MGKWRWLGLAAVAAVFALGPVLALAGLALYEDACSVRVDVPQPQIEVGCVEVVLGSSVVRYCDGGVE